MFQKNIFEIAMWVCRCALIFLNLVHEANKNDGSNGVDWDSFEIDKYYAADHAENIENKE